MSTTKTDTSFLTTLHGNLTDIYSFLLFSFCNHRSNSINTSILSMFWQRENKRIQLSASLSFLEPDTGGGEDFDDSETDGSIISESDTRVNLAVSRLNSFAFYSMFSRSDLDGERGRGYLLSKDARCLQQRRISSHSARRDATPSGRLSNEAIRRTTISSERKAAASRSTDWPTAQCSRSLERRPARRNNERHGESAPDAHHQRNSSNSSG